MNWQKFFGIVNHKFGLSLMTGLLSIITTHSVMSAPAQDPLFLAQPVRPIMMLNMSRDHQLFFKLYDDYSDITNATGGARDGRADTTYIHAYDYYGYFDSAKCYVYNSNQNRFNPTRFADDDKYCNFSGNTNSGSEWSGNFLNWATMTRMDAVRKILYGGMRSSDGDTADLTVLERAFLPQDAHSFAKYYNGTDINKLTPFDSSNSVTMGADNNNSGITICNTTEPTDRDNLSQEDTGLPRMRVARGNYSLWASNERWQCRWGTASNDNDPDSSGIKAHTSSPAGSGDNSRRLGSSDFRTRVRVCVAGLIGDENNENCAAYNGKWKPIGLLQEYGATGLIQFGLMTGSYVNNKSGGVLRKQIGVMTDEINANGTFVRPDNDETHYGIIQTLDLLRIYGYRFDDGTYHNGGHGVDSGGSDGCLWSRSSFNNGHCTNWGNPQSEIFLESLRYLSGQSVSEDFSADDSDRIEGLNTAAWGTPPITNDNYCAPLSVIQFNASTSSFDGDELDAGDIGLADVSAATNVVGTAEGINNQSYFIGSNGTNTDQLCTAKTVANLANASGTCPDAPRLEGSYKIAGLAHYARTTGIPLEGVTRGAGRQKVKPMALHWPLLYLG